MALIIYNPSVIFVHIPKTAGTSITAGLEKSFYSIGRFRRRLIIARERLIHNRCPVHGIDELPKHVKAKDIKLFVGRDLWNKSATCACVRNPWDLMVSSYHWWLQKARQWKKCHKDIQFIEELGSFTAFMSSEYGQKINEYHGNYYDWLCSDSGEIIVRHILKFEELDTDWYKLCQETGLPQIALPHVNQSKHDTYRSYYDDRTKDLVAKRFSWSIEQFGYEF